MWATNFYKIFSKYTGTVGCQKFVNYIRMFYTGCFILDGILQLVTENIIKYKLIKYPD